MTTTKSNDMNEIGRQIGHPLVGDGQTDNSTAMQAILDHVAYAKIALEDTAKRIYSAMKWAAENAENRKPPAWVEGGNSLAQGEARRCARDIQENAVKIKPLVWSEITPPNQEYSYMHVVAKTALGVFSIEWKSHKNDYDVYINGHNVGDRSDNLDDAKAVAQSGYESLVRSTLCGEPLRGEVGWNIYVGELPITDEERARMRSEARDNFVKEQTARLSSALTSGGIDG